jgi:putative phage-type endonuclease
MQQRSDEWFQARCGRVTASRIADVVAQTKSGWSASRDRYMGQLIAERLTQRPAESYTSTAMQWGIDNEAAAVEAYEAITLSVVEPAGFFVHPNITLAGASPDGLVGDEGLVEIKAPETHTHLDTLIAANHPRRDPIQSKYRFQMQWQMACSGRQWCDFVSYDPRLSPELQLWTHRVERDEKLIAELEGKVIDFLEELEKRVEALRSYK